MMKRALPLLMCAAVGCGNGSSSGALACPTSIDAFCAMPGNQTLCSWAAESASAAHDCQTVLLLASCGGYHVALDHGVDTGTYYYYDSGTGRLVAAVFNDVSQRMNCTAGPTAGFSPPGCPSDSFEGCPDGG